MMINRLYNCKLKTGRRSLEFNQRSLDGSIVSRFNEIVSIYPQRSAIELPGRVVTYLELDAFSDNVADYLIERFSVKRQGFAVLMNGELPFYITILGILKSCNYYIPIEPSFPEERISYILGDLDPEAIVVDGLGFSCVTSECFSVVSFEEMMSHTHKVHERDDVLADDTSFVIYTSGTTGHPKGVVQCHGNILHNCAMQSEIYHISPDDRFSQLHVKSVMGAVRAIYNAFLNGACLCPFNLKDSDFTRLAGWLKEINVSIFHLPSSVFRSFVGKIGDKSVYDTIRLVILGGESVKEMDYMLYVECFNETCILCTGLGSTETCTTRMMLLDKSSMPSFHSGHLPLGYAVKDMEITLEDEDGNLVGEGHIGEIVVNSKYLAQGYWNCSKETFEPFVKESINTSQPYSYNTGDLGKFMPDGCLVHMGRKDHQVKIRGNRIEIREIELALESFSYISRAVVVSSTSSQNIRLSAFVVFRDSRRFVEHAIKSTLRRILPLYMIPEHLFLIDKIPLTPNGKTDYVLLRKMNDECCLEMSYDESLTDDDTSAVAIDNLHLDEREARLFLVKCFENAHVVSLKNSDLRSKILTEGSSIKLKDLDIDSLAKMHLCVDFERSIGISLDIELLDDDTSVHQLVQLIVNQKNDISLSVVCRVYDSAYSAASRMKKLLFACFGSIRQYAANKLDRKLIQCCTAFVQRHDVQDDLNSSRKMFQDYVAVSQEQTSFMQQYLTRSLFECIMTPIDVMYFQYAVLKRFTTRSTHWDWVRKLFPAFSRDETTVPKLFFRKKMMECFHLYGDMCGPDGKTLLICFSGNAHRMMMPLPFFLQELDPCKTDVLLIKDPAKKGYRTGVEGISDSIEVVIDQIPCLVDLSSYKRTAAIGTSGGGFPALLTAIRLGLDASLSVGSCGPFDAEWIQYAHCSPFELTKRNLRLNENMPIVNLCYGTASLQDYKSALEFSDIVPSHMIPVENYGHNAILYFYSNNGLGKLLTETIFFAKG